MKTIFRTVKLTIDYRILLFFFTLGLISCNTNAQQVDNTKPMYGEVQKTEEHEELDKDFVKDCLAKYKTIDSAVNFHIDYAWRYFYNNDLKTAMKRFNQAWLLNPEFPDSYFGFAALLEMQKNKAEGERFYILGLEKDKMLHRAEICYQRIADCKEQLGDIGGTIEAYTKITKLNATSAMAFKKIGYLQMDSNNSDAAVEAYDKAIELDPNDAVTFNNRGYLYQTAKESAKAISDYTKAIKLDPKYIGAYVNRGITQAEINNNQAAKKDFEICVQLDSKAGELRRFLGLSKLSLNDKVGACKDFELAKQLGDLQADEFIRQNCK